MLSGGYSGEKELLATLLIGVSITLVGCRNEDIGSEEKVEQLAEKSIIAEQSKEDGQTVSICGLPEVKFTEK